MAGLGSEKQPITHELVGNQPSFLEMLDAKEREGKHVCIGFDPPIDGNMYRFPGMNNADSVLAYNKKIIDSTYGIAAAFKPNLAFYLAMGHEGVRVLEETVKYSNEKYPEIITIIDMKANDIGNTAEGWAKFAFDVCGADAVTVNPYLGREALMPFLKRKGKGIFVLSRTSNDGAGEFQDLKVGVGQRPLHQAVAEHVVGSWNDNGNLGIVMGATNPEKIEVTRKLFPKLPMLVPGVGEQGGRPEEVVFAARRRFIINSSSGIYMASKGADFAEAARTETEKLHFQIGDALALV